MSRRVEHADALSSCANCPTAGLRPASLVHPAAAPRTHARDPRRSPPRAARRRHPLAPQAAAAARRRTARGGLDAAAPAEVGARATRVPLCSGAVVPAYQAASVLLRRPTARCSRRTSSALCVRVLRQARRAPDRFRARTSPLALVRAASSRAPRRWRRRVRCALPAHRPGESARDRRPTCSHNHPGGRCLVLDPFCRPGIPTAEAALYTGRSFLGITEPREGERR